MKDQIIYVEIKSGYNDNGPAWIGKSTRSKSGRTIYFNGKAFQPLGGTGIQGNHRDIETGEEYWISGVKKNQADRHWAGYGIVMIDELVVKEYLIFTGLRRLDLKRFTIVQLDHSDVADRVYKLENRMSSDPRNGRFYALKKKDSSQLSVIEIRELMAVCDKMVEFVTAKKGRRSWSRYRVELSELLEQLSRPH